MDVIKVRNNLPMKNSYVMVRSEPAIKKYRATPRISIAVVTNGPVATAGSISNRFKIKGTNEPIEAAMIIDAQILSPTTSPSRGDTSRKRKTANIPRRRPYRIPRIRPTRISLKRIFVEFSKFTRPVAKPRTIMVEDCVPILPPMPIITGIKAPSAIVL